MEPVQALSLLSEVHVLSLKRKYQEVLGTLEHLDIAELIAEPELALHILNAMLYVYRTEEGLSLSEELLEKEELLPHRQFANRIRITRSGHLSRTGALQEAQECLQRCLETCRWNEANRYTADVWNNLGIVYSMRGDWATAISELRRALGMYQQLGNRHGVASASRARGLAARSWGGFEDAEDCFQSAASYYKEEGITQEVTASEAERALALAGLGDVRLAEVMARRAVRRCSESENEPLLGEVLRVLGTVLRCAGTFGEARATLLRAYTLGKVERNEALKAETRVELGLLSYALGDITDGDRHLAAASRLYSAMEAWGYVRRIESVKARGIERPV